MNEDNVVVFRTLAIGMAIMIGKHRIVSLCQLEIQNDEHRRVKLTLFHSKPRKTQ